MKKLKVLNFLLIYFILSFFVCKSSNTYSATSADTNAVAYFPMQVGNVYAYSFFQFPGTPSYGKIKAYISNETIINNHKYYYISGALWEGWYRVDTLTGSFYKYDVASTCPFYFQETFLDSLAALPGNNIVPCGVPVDSQTYYKCIDISNGNIFSIPTTKKVIEKYSGIIHNISRSTKTYSKYFGLTNYETSWQGVLTGGQTSYTLIGCLLNGIRYGDSTLTYAQINLTYPSEWATISTSKYDTSRIAFTWISTQPTNLKYKWKIKKTSANSYLYFNSDSSGNAKNFTIRRSTLDSIVSAFGLTGDSVQCAWSCSSTTGSDSVNGEVRVITIKANTVGISSTSSAIPNKYILYTNYPNPFNPITNITFDIPKSSFVLLKIYDVSGKELISLVNENLKAGSYNYQWDASNFTSGVYFYRIETNEFVQTKRMVLIK